MATYYPLDTNLVVADPIRTDKTICLVVSSSLKACGIPGRPRLFEVVQQVALVNGKRKYVAPGHQLKGKSFSASELAAAPSLELDYKIYVELPSGQESFSKEGR